MFIYARVCLPATHANCLSREYNVCSLRGKRARTNLAAAGTGDAGVQGSRGTRNTGFSGGANVQEFQTFYQESLGRIYRYVYSKVGNREEAEDLTSQIFMKAVRGADTERGAQGMQKWLFQVARTTIADYWRAHYRIATNSLERFLEARCEGPVQGADAEINTRPIGFAQRPLSAPPGP